MRKVFIETKETAQRKIACLTELIAECEDGKMADRLTRLQTVNPAFHNAHQLVVEGLELLEAQEHERLAAMDKAIAEIDRPTDTATTDGTTDGAPDDTTNAPTTKGATP